MDKIDGKSLDLEKENIKKLKELFPNSVTEGKVDFDVLRNLLGDEIDESREKYQFTWNGKTKAIKLAQSPSSSTLRPCKDKSKNWENTENLYIEGDNLEVLKQLQKTYFGKIKLIYIDPPYNTGGDFVYKDDYSNSVENYKEITNQLHQSNPETSGRYHTDWLNMMYPRLLLARNLLSDDGLIFISIDDNEIDNLRKICDEIFGEHNFVNSIAVKMSPSSGVKRRFSDIMFIKNKEYILLYKKNKANINPINDIIDEYDGNYTIFYDEKEFVPLSDLIKKQFPKYEDISTKNYFLFPDLKKFIIDNKNYIYRRHGASQWALDNIDKGNLIFERKNKNASRNYIYKVLNPDNSEEFELLFDTNGGGYERLEPITWKMNEEGNITLLRGDFWNNGYEGDMGNVSKEGEIAYPNGKKPVRLLQDIIYSGTDDGDIILDFFSGSGTTAHATFLQNCKDGKKRKFILVQIPELIDMTKSENKKYYGKLNINNICDLGEERIRRSGELISKNNDSIDVGFKVFALDSTNINPWDNSSVQNETTLLDFYDVFKEDRSEEDIIYEIMLKYGIFDQQVSIEKINDKKLFKVGSRYMVVCLEDNITDDDIMKIGELKPRVVVFKESGFDNDNDKINATHNLEKAGVEEIKCI